jgi:hypothetical protein
MDSSVYGRRPLARLALTRIAARLVSGAVSPRRGRHWGLTWGIRVDVHFARRLAAELSATDKLAKARSSQHV